MVRLLWWVLVGVLVWWGLLKRIKSSTKSSNSTSAPAKQSPSVMVACAHCGIHLPQEDAFQNNPIDKTKFFCSIEHEAQYVRHPS